jgi:hypothetical protein
MDKPIVLVRRRTAIDVFLLRLSPFRIGANLENLHAIPLASSSAQVNRGAVKA